MGCIMHTQHTERGDRNYFAGNVVAVKGPDSDDKPYQVTVRAAVWNNNTKAYEHKNLHLAGWNNEKFKHADILRKMKLKPGAYVFGICAQLHEYTGASGYTTLQSSIFRLSYSGELAITDGEKEYLILCGNVGKLTDQGGCTLAVASYNKDTRERFTQWYNVNFSKNAQASLATATGFKVGAQMCMLVRKVETEKPTKNPVVECLRFDISDPESVLKQEKFKKKK